MSSALAPKNFSVLRGPRVRHRGHGAVQVVDDVDDQAEVVARERRVERDVLQRQLRQLPQRADPAHVGKPDLNSFERLAVLIERAAIRLRPADLVRAAAGGEPTVELGHDERVHRADPRECRRLARRHRQLDRRVVSLRAGRCTQRGADKNEGYARRNLGRCERVLMSAATVSCGYRSGGRRWECSSTASGTTCGTTRRRRKAASSAPRAQFRNWVTPDGTAGPSGRGGFRAEPNRYHLYVAFACPWAHRTLIVRKLKGLRVADRHLGRQLLHGGRGLDVRAGPRDDSRLGESRREALRALHDRGPDVLGPRDGARALGQARTNDRLERVRRDRAYAEQRVRSSRRESQRLLSHRAARRDRRAERASSIRTSTTASIAPASRRRRKRTRKPRRRCSTRSTSSKAGSRRVAISRAPGSRKPTYGSSLR